MKKLLLFIFLITGIAGFSQPGNKSDSNRMKKGKELRKLVLDDSMIKKLQKFKDSAAAAIQVADSNQISKDISRNVDSLLQLQKEQKARQKKSAIIRIGIGAALLVMLIIGLRRRKK